MSATFGEVNRLRVAAVSVRYPVATRSVEWEPPEGTVPESAVHDAACKHERAARIELEQRVAELERKLRS